MLDAEENAYMKLLLFHTMKGEKLVMLELEKGPARSEQTINKAKEKQNANDCFTYTISYA